MANRRERRAAARQGDATTICSSAAALTAQGRLEEAVKRYRQALAADPRSPIAHNNLASVLSSLGRVDEAVTHLRQALIASPRSGEIHNNLGNALRRLCMTEAAVSHYHEAIALIPDFPEAHLNLGTALRALGRAEEAAGILRRLIALQPGHVDAMLQLGLVLLDLGLVVEALEQAEAASRFADRPGFSHYTLGVLLARAGATDAARVCLEAHLAADPQDSDGVALLLASLGFAPLPERASDIRIQHLYAERALAWDDAASGPFGYRGAALVADALTRLIGEPRRLAIADAGCGTGLVGALLRDQASRLEGVDLSAAMLAKAREKQVYDALHEDDLVRFLDARPAAFDVVTCAATLIHFGDLAPAFAAAARALRAQGLFIATLFPADDMPDGYAVAAFDGLAEGSCYRHGRDYVAATAASAGFEVAILENAVHEFQNREARIGLVVGLRRRA
jgi:predicted TPR repeat methyltransferase